VIEWRRESDGYALLKRGSRYHVVELIGDRVASAMPSESWIVSRDALPEQPVRWYGRSYAWERFHELARLRRYRQR
jgi:hypothetical protein